jgi:hypothetical protein
MEQGISQNNPTNRELMTLIETNREKNELQHAAIMESLKLFHDTTKITLEGILAQTTKTNGTVKGLTNDVWTLKGWRTGIVMCIALIAFLLTLSSNIIPNLFK